MRLLILSITLLLFSINQVFAQANEAAMKKEKEKMIKEIQIKQDEYVNDFLSTLNIDDFQKEIIKQKMHSYFEAKKAIYIENQQEIKRMELVEQLDSTHFLDIKEMVTEDTMSKIMESVKGTAKTKDKKKKNKKND